MSHFSNASGLILGQPISLWNAPDTTARAQVGTMVSAVSSVFGGGLFVYLAAGGTIAQGNLCTYAAGSATQVPNTANTGAAVVVAMYPMTIGQYGWFMASGQLPVSVTASVAAGVTFGLTGAGTVGAVTAGKQILNAKSVQPSTNTSVKANVSTTNGSNRLRVTGGSEGWFYGITVSGTGIPASTTVIGFSSDGREVIMSANATATGSVTVTGTYTNFILAQVNASFVQGQIT